MIWWTMARKDDEREFRLRPAKPRAQKEGAAWSTGFKLLIHYARSSRNGTPRGGSSGTPARAHNQRCAVRIVYSKNTTKGQWRAHGRYLARESATLEQIAKGAGFTAEAPDVDIAAELERWQAARDPLLWKLIISPEFGDRADLQRLTRDLMERISTDLKTNLEWIAVAHHNTEHPHVHVALRGVAADGTTLKLERQYIKAGVRNLAEELCTQQLGYRTTLDAAEAERREIFDHRFTSLDRVIIRRSKVPGEDVSGELMLQANVGGAGQRGVAQLREQHVVSRLAFLETMGLATQSSPGWWRVQRNFESILRAMQRTNDRQKMISAHGVLASDERLPIRVLQWQDHPEGIQGRILVHGEDDLSGRNYLMLEGTDAGIHFIQYTPEMEAARSQCQLRTNSFVRLRRVLLDDGGASTDIQELGDADSLLTNRGHFRSEAQRLMKRGTIPTEQGWGGWLGDYQRTLRRAAHAMEEHRPNKERERRLDLGR
jgi:type IV secretory pathway VirD2 relaxase